MPQQFPFAVLSPRSGTKSSWSSSIRPVVCGNGATGLVVAFGIAPRRRRVSTLSSLAPQQSACASLDHQNSR